MEHGIPVVLLVDARVAEVAGHDQVVLESVGETRRKCTSKRTGDGTFRNCAVSPWSEAGVFNGFVHRRRPAAASCWMETNTLPEFIVGVVLEK